MNRTLLTIAAATVLSAPAMGKYNRMFEMYSKVADVDADGLDDIILIDANTGHFVTGFGESGGGFAWQTPRQIPSFPMWHQALARNDTLSTVADLDHDGAGDLAISLYHRNRVLVFRGSSTRSRALASMEEYFPGPGPAGIAAAQLDTATPELELVLPVIALTQPRTVGVLPRVGWEVLVDYGPIDPEVAAGLTGFALMDPAATGNQQGRPVSHTQGTFTLTFNGQTANPTNHLQVSLLTGNKPPAGADFAEPYRHLFAANMRGPDEPGQFVLWAPGLDLLAIATVTENPGAVAMETLVIQVEGIDSVSGIGSPGSLDRIAVVHQEGTRVTVLGWDPARHRFEPKQTLNAPQGRTFAGPIGKLGNGLFAMMSDGRYLKYQYDAAGQLQLTHQGALPQLPAFGVNATVMLYTADPLGGDAFEFESFVAGQWATGATFAGGKINATREIFQSPLDGLGQPAAVLLTPSANPGAGAQAQANQFGDASSSLFFAGDVSADGDAGVQISPPPGDYSLPVHIQFTPAAESTTVVYRVNGQAWQQAAGTGFFVASDALVEYYGQAAGGALSTIQTASYQVSLSFASDANHDGLPDDIAVALGLDPFGDGDADNDGVSDINEVLNDSDPFLGNSLPKELAVEFPPPLKFNIVSNIPDGPGLAGDAPALNVSYTLFLPDGTPVRAQTAVTGRITGIAVDPSSAAGAEGRSAFRNSIVAEANLPGSEPLAGGASMLGVVFPPELALPALSSGGGPEWIPVASFYLENAWPRKVGGLKLESDVIENGGETQTIVIDADTTLAVAAFSAWTYHALEDAGRVRRHFPWDHRSGRSPVSTDDIVLLEEPQNPAQTWRELNHYTVELHNTIVENPDYAPLRVAAREMIEAGRIEYPNLVFYIPDAAQAILNFFDTGVLDDFYAGVITPTPAVMQALRAQLLGVPQPRLVVEITGGLIPQADGRLFARTAGGAEYDLRGTRSVSEVVDGEVLITRRPYVPAIPVTAGGTYRMVLMASAFLTAAPGEPQPMEVFSILPEAADLSHGIIDTDGDGMDDTFESFYFNGLSTSFWDDTDRDGFSDGEEYQALANPGDASDVPPGIPSTPRTLWKKAQFGGNWNDPVIAADEEDPDFDGMSTLLEYMTGGDPDNPNDAPQPRAASLPDGRLGLAFNRIPDRTDIVIDVESSDSLTGPWQVLARSTGGGAMTAMVEGVTVMESGAGPTRQVSVSDSTTPANPATTRKFLRVSVTAE